MEENKNWFQLSGNYGAGYFNHDNGYSDTQSLSASANSGLGFLLDPTGTVAGLWNDITGVSAQSREFSQQEYLQDKQNAYNAPKEQMKRLEAAGINPNLAAGGVVQGGNESAQAPSVSSNTSGAAQGLGAAAAALTGIGSLAGQAASAKLAETQAANIAKNTSWIDRLNTAEIGSMIGKTATDLENVGIESIDAARAAITLGSGSFDTIKHILDSDGVIRMYDKKFTMLEKQIRNENATYKEKVANIDLIYSEVDENTKTAALNEAKANHEVVLQRLDEIKEEIMNGLRQDPYWNEFQVGWDIARKYGIDSDEYHNYMTYVQQYSYYQTSGALKSEVENAFNLEKNKQEGHISPLAQELQTRLDARQKELAQDKDFQSELAKIGVASEAANKVISLFLKYLFGVGFSVTYRNMGVTNTQPSSL